MLKLVYFQCKTNQFAYYSVLDFQRGPPGKFSQAYSHISHVVLVGCFFFSSVFVLSDSVWLESQDVMFVSFFLVRVLGTCT